MKGLHLIVPPGGTREPIDDVRYIGNVSTGRLGARIAEEALLRGHDVLFLHAAGSVLPSPGNREAGSARLSLEEFVTARDLSGGLEKALCRIPDPCAAVMAAAVADYAPVRRPGKIPSSGEELTLALRRVDKIVDRIKTWNPGVLLVKFKLESGRSKDDLVAVGLESARRSRADLVLVNDIAAIRGGKHPAVLLWPEEERRLDLEGKESVARAIVAALEEMAALR